MSLPHADAKAEAPAVVSDVACTVCGCVCDDLQLTIVGNRVTRVEPTCPLAEQWFQSVQAHEPPHAAVEGQAASLNDALDRAAAILAGARHVLIFGLSRSSTAGAREAVRLADRLGASIDPATSRSQAAAIAALQEVGQSTCTLGEVRHRADLVIYWGSDPAVTHPRHMQRYTMRPEGQFIASRDERTLAVIDVQPTQTSQQADLFLQVRPGGDFDLLWALRAIVRGVPLESPPGTSETSAGGVAMAAVEDLARRMKTCRSGIIFFGDGLTAHGLGHRTVEALFRLVAELNGHTRFYAQRMRGTADLGTASNVLCWQTGFPHAVNFNRGYPRFSPEESSADELLRRGEVDACLLLGSGSAAALSDEARASLAQLPTAVLDEPHVPPMPTATVRFTTAIYGLHRPGTAYRMDEVPIPLKTVLRSHYPSDAEVLAAIDSRLGE